MLHDERIRQGYHGFGARSTYALERGLDCGGRPHLSKGNTDIEPFRAQLGFFQLALLAGMQWIGQYRHARDVRKRLTQEFDPLRIHLVGHVRCAGEISAWSADAIHQPSLHRIAAITEHHGSRVDCSAHEGHDRSLRHDNLYVERQQFAQEFWHAITDIGRPTLFDNDGSTLDVVQLPQSLSNGIKELRSLGRADCDPPDPRHPCRLLRACGKRIYRCRTAEKHEEISAFHSITSSARASSDGDTVMPRILAV